MSESRDTDTGSGDNQATSPEPPAEQTAARPTTSSEDEHAGRRRFRLSRRGWTVVCSGVLVVVFALLGALVRVPYVALGPGPTYNTLGEVEGNNVVSIDGERSYPSSGELDMTTVSLDDEVTLFGALGLWVSGRYALAPREDYFQPGQTDEDIRRQNVRQFRDSQSNAEVAALRTLGYPVKVIVAQVVNDSPASGRLEPGDRIVEVNGQRAQTQEAVLTALEDTRPGQRVSMTYERAGEGKRTDAFELGRHPDGQPQGFIGIQPADRADVPFDVDVSLEDVGGPSAGLLFALAIVERMEAEELMSGQHVAGTGEIDSQGNIGAIGGISFKLVAASEAGAQSFLVPERNCAEALSAAPDGLQLIKVGTLDDAVGALRALRDGRPVETCGA